MLWTAKSQFCPLNKKKSIINERDLSSSKLNLFYSYIEICYFEVAGILLGTYLC